MSKLQNIVMIVMILYSPLVCAVDFGKVGQSFPILEEGFVAMIKRKLGDVDIDHHNKKMSAIAKDRVQNPPAVNGVTRTRKHNVFYYDPTYILKEDVKLPDGKIIYKAGTSVNPLEKMEFDRRLIFINGVDERQVKWLESLTPQESLQDRIILVEGRILDLQETLGKQLYFDQAGEITTRLGIKHVPAIATSYNKMIKIEEILPDDS